MTELRQVFTTPDGQHFDTKAEAIAHLRRPKVLAALNVVTGGNGELASWLQDNEETIVSAFETGTIKRVTKSEAKKLEKALEALKEITGVPALAFLQENAGAVKESFRWPSVKRMSEEEKATQARNTLLAATDGDEQLVQWILGNKDQILTAYEAGVEKRKVSPNAAAALAAYQAKKAAEREAAKAAEAGEASDEAEGSDE